MIVIDGGTFLIGETEGARTEPVHRVTIDRPLAVSVYEVTEERARQLLALWHSGTGKPPGGSTSPESVRAARHRGQSIGVDPGLLATCLWRRAGWWSPPVRPRLQAMRSSGWRLLLQRVLTSQAYAHRLTNLYQTKTKAYRTSLIVRARYCLEWPQPLARRGARSVSRGRNTFELDVRRRLWMHTD